MCLTMYCRTWELDGFNCSFYVSGYLVKEIVGELAERWIDVLNVFFFGASTLKLTTDWEKSARVLSDISILDFLLTFMSSL